MSWLLDLWTTICVTSGVIFFLAGKVGLLRFPDVFSRLHALTKADNLGLGLIVVGLLPQSDTVASGLKLVAVWLLAQVSAATASRLIAGAVHRDRASP